MTIVPVDPHDPSPEILADAAQRLRDGELVAFPTETVYGLGANALDAAAVQRIFDAKGRPAYNPLIVHVASAARAQDVVRVWPEHAARLAKRFWPGPLTLVLPKRREIPDIVSGALDTVGVRVPAHPVALALLRAAKLPIAAPSANRSMGISPTTAQHVQQSLGDRVALILDGGPTHVGIESTVLDLSGATPMLLRPGMIGIKQLTPYVGDIALAKAVGDGEARGSPGMMARHYAPRARVLLVDAQDSQAASATAVEARRSGTTTGAVLRTLLLDADHEVRLPGDAAAYARDLYSALHRLDDAGCDLIIIERPPDEPAWFAVRDRLERSARPPVAGR